MWRTGSARHNHVLVAFLILGVPCPRPEGHDMTITTDDSTTVHDHVPPRPVTRLPDLALAAARKKAAARLVEVFGIDPDAASCIANASVDPAELRRSIDTPIALAITGGNLLAVRARVWTRRVLPDIRNPRIGDARRHPIAIEPGTDEESRFAPVDDPTSDGAIPHLQVEIESVEHMTWASALAARSATRASSPRCGSCPPATPTPRTALLTCGR
jgi:hypothetical protein